jgi:hypothetical protein
MFSGPRAILFREYHARLALPGDTRLRAGHDYRNQPVSTIGWEKRNNACLAHRSRAGFVKLMGELNLPKRRTDRRRRRGQPGLHGS